MLARSRDADVLRARLLESSELRIEEAAQEPRSHASLAASRVLESTQAWREWGLSHNLLLNSIVEQRNSAQQSNAVKRMALSVIHRKAPFEFLRDHGVRGGERRQYFQGLYGRSHYARAVVLEHRHFLGAMCSYLCVERFCGTNSWQRIRHYERRYTNYWTLHSQAMARRDEDEITAAMDSAVVRSLRNEIRELREQLLGTAPSAADRYTLEELRRPTGDTVRLRLPRDAYQR